MKKYILILIIFILYSCSEKFRGGMISKKKFNLYNIEMSKTGAEGFFFLGCGSLTSGELFYYFIAGNNTVGIKPFTVKEFYFDKISFYFIPKTEKPYVIFKCNRCNTLRDFAYWNHSYHYYHFYIPEGSIKNNYNINLER